MRKYPSTLGLNLVTSPISISLSTDPLDKVSLATHYVIEDALDLGCFF